MYNPKEAVEDSHAVNLAVLFFVGLALLIAIYLHHDGALKYWLLTHFGKETTGTVISLESSPDSASAAQARKRESLRNYLKNSNAWLYGDRLHIEYRPEGKYPLTLTITMPQDMIGKTVTKALPVSYLPVNPKIAYPADYLSEFAFDSRVVLWALVIGVFIGILSYDAVRAWHKFRRRMHRY